MEASRAPLLSQGGFRMGTPNRGPRQTSQVFPSDDCPVSLSAGRDFASLSWGRKLGEEEASCFSRLPRAPGPELLQGSGNPGPATLHPRGRLFPCSSEAAPRCSSPVDSDSHDCKGSPQQSQEEDCKWPGSPAFVPSVGGGNSAAWWGWGESGLPCACATREALGCLGLRKAQSSLGGVLLGRPTSLPPNALLGSPPPALPACPPCSPGPVACCKRRGPHLAMAALCLHHLAALFSARCSRNVDLCQLPPRKVAEGSGKKMARREGGRRPRRGGF